MDRKKRKRRAQDYQVADESNVETRSMKRRCMGQDMEKKPKFNVSSCGNGIGARGKHGDGIWNEDKHGDKAMNRRRRKNRK